MNIITTLLNLLQSGLGGLAAYLAAHVLLCLLPAFFIAVPWRPCCLRKPSPAIWGGMPPSGFLSSRCTIRVLIGGLLLYDHAAVCRNLQERCRVLAPPLPSFLLDQRSTSWQFHLLASNWDGYCHCSSCPFDFVWHPDWFINGVFFRKDDADHAEQTANNNLFEGKAKIPTHKIVFFLLLLGILLVGTLQIGVLRNVFYEISLPGNWASELQMSLDSLIHLISAWALKG